MALPTGGTTSATALSAIKIGGVSASPANYALFNAACKDWLKIEGTKYPPTCTLSPAGLFIPDRGLMSVWPGDVVMVDANSGAVVIVPAVSFAGTPQWITTAN